MRSVPASASARYDHVGGTCHVPDAGVFSEFERSIIRSRVNAGLARARFHGTKRGKPIGQQPLPRHKVDAIRAELQKATGILKTARLCGTGVSAVQRIKATMKQAA
jgi:DNA invertase Pin-like site-specific DNA recombinase